MPPRAWQSQKCDTRDLKESRALESWGGRAVQVGGPPGPRQAHPARAGAGGSTKIQS